jgi:flagellar assembly protein FliH
MSNPASILKKDSAYTRWEMASFDPPKPSSIDPDAAAASAAVRQAAHAEGLAAGHRDGHAAGYAAGIEEGRRLGAEQVAAEAARLAALADSFDVALRAVDSEVADTLLDLAFDIARQVVGQTIATDPTALLGVARELIASEPTLSGSPHLVVNPADMAVIQAYLSDELQAAGWTVRSDPTIERGGCRAKAATGEIDATAASRWERVAQALGRHNPW